MAGAQAVSTLYGIGLGPGDPELITLKALRILQRVAVVAYPAPEHGESLARRIAAPHLPGGQREIAIRMPLTLDRFPARAVYDQAVTALEAELDAGRDVAVLCLGDPLLYGSFMYLLARLDRARAVTIVPGITSIAAAAARVAMPLAARDDSFAVLSAGLDDATLERHLRAVDGAAILKLGRHFTRVRALLQRLGRGDARYVAHVGMADENEAALDQVDAATVPYFALILTHRRGDAARP